MYHLKIILYSDILCLVTPLEPLLTPTSISRTMGTTRATTTIRFSWTTMTTSTTSTTTTTTTPTMTATTTTSTAFMPIAIYDEHNHFNYYLWVTPTTASTLRRWFSPTF